MKELNLEEIHKETLELLKVFHDICESNGFSYFLAYGTLLGAIRHNGFIPWDDDVDVWMPRNDFEKFKEYCLSNDIFPLKFCNRKNTKNYYYGVTRFSDTRFKYVVTGYEKPFELGVFLDIYPLDNFGTSLKQANKILTHTRTINRLYSAYINPSGRTAVLRLLRPPLHLLMHIRYGNNYNTRVDDDIKRYINSKTSDDDMYVGIPSCSLAKKAVVYPKTLFDKRVMVDFEGSKFYAPLGWDDILKIEFGDYLELPPEEQRHPYHSYKIYK